MRSLGVLLLACLATSCTDAAPGDAVPVEADFAADVGAATLEADEASARARQAAAELQAAALGDSPRGVVDLLLRGDTAGLRDEPAWAQAMDELFCHGSDTSCTGDEPGWDFVVAVIGYQLDEDYVAEDSASFTVVFDELGVVWPDGLDEVQSGGPRTLTLRRVGGRWRILGAAALPPHLSVDAIARRYRGVQPDSAVIARWLHERASY